MEPSTSEKAAHQSDMKWIDKMKAKDFHKLHDKLVELTLEYSNHLIQDGIKSVSWTLTNDFVVSFRDLKRKPRSKK